MKKIFLILGIILVIVCAISFAISWFFFYSRMHTYDGSAKLFARQTKSAFRFLVGGVVILISAVVCIFFSQYNNSSREVNLRIVSIFTEDMYVNDDGTVGHSTRNEYNVKVKPKEDIINGIARLKSVGDDSILIELDKGYIAFHAQKPGGKHMIKKGEALEFFMDGLLDATAKYVILFE